jgi:hypothetical protein
MILSLASESLGATKPISQPRTQGGQVSRAAFQFPPLPDIVMQSLRSSFRFSNILF